ncbi:MAG: RdgB/HAM1 family non-canonical purine NTP pyrophosphatase, partial [Methylococcaceae bacterium]|nr:RdgB/HAM1 family non-canonical purine NTP pyrophosphatase [Methylococcaceae bacterium]
REIHALLHGVEVLPQSQFGIQEPEETGTTFVENAIIKARNAARHSKLPAIADDSGLVVDALHGAPGVISARYAGTAASDQDNWQKLLLALDGVAEHQRNARFICVMVYLRHAEDPLPIIAQGVWEGSILTSAMGENGFGYDPVFWLKDLACSSAQLSPEQKNRLSHRAKALKDLQTQIQSA